MSLSISNKTEHTERIIRELLQRYRCLSGDQFFTLLPTAASVAPEHIEYVLDSCIIKKYIYKDGPYYLATMQDMIDHAHIDSIWIMLSHIGVEELSKAPVMPTLTHKVERPIRMCYEKGDSIYYLVFLKDESELPHLRVVEEYLKSMSTDGLDEEVKIIVGTWDKNILAKSPKLSYPTMYIMVDHKDGLYENQPEFQSKV